jgi:hypothetical protein
MTLTPLTPGLCRRKAEEARKLAADHRLSAREKIMIEHIAETWDRLAVHAQGDDEQ